MWKALSIIAICMSLSSEVNAQKTVNLPITCDKPERIASVLVKYGEKPIFYGMDDVQKVDNLSLAVFYNKETKTFSVVFTAPDSNIVCVLSSGNQGTMVP